MSQPDGEACSPPLSENQLIKEEPTADRTTISSSVAPRAPAPVSNHPANGADGPETASNPTRPKAETQPLGSSPNIKDDRDEEGREDDPFSWPAVPPPPPPSTKRKAVFEAEMPTAKRPQSVISGVSTNPSVLIGIAIGRNMERGVGSSDPELQRVSQELFGALAPLLAPQRGNSVRRGDGRGNGRNAASTSGNGIGNDDASPAPGGDTAGQRQNRLRRRRARRSRGVGDRGRGPSN